jgi:hypothetical protein
MNIIAHKLFFRSLSVRLVFPLASIVFPFQSLTTYLHKGDSHDAAVTVQVFEIEAIQQAKMFL